MSGKLVKYDLLALARVLLPVQIGVLGVCILVSIGLTITMRTNYGSNSFYGSGALDLLGSMSVLGVLLVCAVLLAGFFMTLFLVARHFYLNIYSDEGYLTMTLPATVNQHIISKTVSGFIWVLINGLVMLLGIGIVYFFGLAYEGLINLDLVQSLEISLSHITRYSPLLLVVYPLAVSVGALGQLLCVYACLAGGCAWAKKHRVALAVGLIFAVNIVTSIIGSVGDAAVATFTGDGSMLSFLYLGSTTQLYDYYLATSVVSLFIGGALIVAYYAFMHHSLANRLNLE